MLSGIIILLIVCFVFWYHMDKTPTESVPISTKTQLGSKEDFVEEVIGLFELTLNYCKCMQHYIDPAVCWFTIGFDRKGTFVMVTSMMRDTFDKEFGANIAGECLCDGRLIFVGDKVRLRKFFDKTDNNRSGASLVQWYNCSNRYDIDSCKIWLKEYLQAKYPYYNAVEENNSDCKKIRIYDLLRKYN